jgi:uncharacterized protein with GYD domain
MPMFIMATRIDSSAVSKPEDLESLEKNAVAKIAESCPEVTWHHSFAVLGPYDYLDLFEAPDLASAQKVSVLIRAHGRAHSEIWPATRWQDFKTALHSLSA